MVASHTCHFIWSLQAERVRSVGLNLFKKSVAASSIPVWQNAAYCPIRISECSERILQSPSVTSRLWQTESYFFTETCVLGTNNLQMGKHCFVILIHLYHLLILSCPEWLVPTLERVLCKNMDDQRHKWLFISSSGEVLARTLSWYVASLLQCLYLSVKFVFHISCHRSEVCITTIMC